MTENYFDIRPLPLERTLKWNLRFLELAQLVASWSHDPSTKIGAVIVRPDKTVLSMGYNGFPRHTNDDPALYADRARKYERIVHAELNAILNAHGRADGCTLYVWPPMGGPTCARCAAAVIQAGIQEVTYVHKAEPEFNQRWADSMSEAQEMYNEAQVEIIAIQEKAWTNR